MSGVVPTKKLRRPSAQWRRDAAAGARGVPGSPPGGAQTYLRSTRVPCGVGDSDPEARIDMARNLGRFKTSMLQDLEAGKALEIDGLLTGTLEVARKAGVPAPFTESLSGLARLRAQSTGQYT